MPWIRFPVWDRWRDLTRFRIAAEAALAAEHTRWSNLPVVDPDTVIVNYPSRSSEFRCSLKDYISALESMHTFYSMILSSYIGLTEQHGRDIIEKLCNDSRYANSFPGLNNSIDAGAAAEEYIKTQSVEVWGEKLLLSLGRDWNNIAGGRIGKAEIIEIFVIRNILVHGLTEINQRAMNRLTSAGYLTGQWVVGTPVILNKQTIDNFIANLRAFNRLISDGAANI